VKQAAHEHLDPGVCALDVGHNFASFRRIEAIRHKTDLTSVVSLTAPRNAFSTSWPKLKEPGNTGGHMGRQQGWYGISDLFRNFDLATGEPELIGKGLKSGCFSMSNRPILRGMKIATLFRLKKFCPNRAGWPIPPKPPKKIRPTRGLAYPTRRRQFR
jgi:hypothetical protein